MSRPTTVEMPPSAASAPPPSTILIESTISSVVLVGANGSGKTRLGAWLEITGPQARSVYRVGAQKSLDFPDAISPTSIERSRRALHYGIDDNIFSAYQLNSDSDFEDFKVTRKWNKKPATGMLTDFGPLMTYLFTDDYQVSSKYRRETIAASAYVAPPETTLDRVQKIWQQILPHRLLQIEEGEVKVKLRDDATKLYKASEMSDGERAAFYLIGQCLGAPADSIIVIDEPEVHLHRIIQARLWDVIEQERPDCLLVYLTHDLAFASSRSNAIKIWLKAFDGTSWDWRLVPTNSEGLPEELLLAVLGSRKPILFVEGQRGSLDKAVFALIYPDWTIMPREGCDKVIEATKAFRGLRNLHGIECYGIVDRDYRTPEQIADLLTKGVYVLDMQEMDNLLLIEPVLNSVAVYANAHNLTNGESAAEVVRKAKEYIFTTLSREIPLLASRKAAWELETNLHKIDRKITSLAALEGVRDNAARFDVASAYNGFERQLNQLITDQDYTSLLRVYNNKGLGSLISRYFGIQSYPDVVKQLIKTSEGTETLQALRAAAPVLPPVMIATE
jgi:ABC-type dipeptide/oligopeptide/nickel transport system ATPase component